MAKINNIPTLTAYQQKFLAWQLDRRRSSSDEDKFTSVLAEAQVDLNPHQVDAALFAFKSPLSMGAVLADEVGLGKSSACYLTTVGRATSSYTCHCSGNTAKTVEYGIGGKVFSPVGHSGIQEF